MSPEARAPTNPSPRDAAWRDAALGALIMAPVAVALSQVSPVSYRSGAASIALLVVLGLSMRWTVAAGAAPVLWLAILAQITDDFSESPSAREDVGAVVGAAAIAVVVIALRRWEGDRRQARAEAQARLRNERRLQALVDFARHLATVGNRPGLYAAVEREVRLAAGSSGAVLVVGEGDRIGFPAVAGLDPELFAGRVPIGQRGTPAGDVLRTGQPLFFADAADLLGRYPDLERFVRASNQNGWAALPVRNLGVLVLTWSDAQLFSRAQRAFLETIANLFGTAADRIRTVEQAQLERFAAAFDAMLDGVGIHRAVRDRAGRAVDLEIEYLNPASVADAAQRAELVGRRMSEVWPASPLLPQYLRVVETGEPFLLEDADVASLGGPYSDTEAVSIRASRLDAERIVLVVRDVSERARLIREIREANEMFSVAQDLAHVGGWRYDFVTDRLDWSAELYRIVGVPEGAEPVRPVDGSLFGVEHPDDRGMVAHAISNALAQRAPFTFDTRIVRQSDGEVRDVSTTGIVRVDGEGAVIGVWGATQDITDRRRAERSRRAALDALEHQREAVAALQRVILPEALPDVAGAELAAQYRAATLSNAVGGDWYDAFPTPDGRVVLAIGDVAGHGLECAALANQLRVSVRVRVRDGMEPGQILASLDTELDDGFVTCWLATYDPVTRVLHAASAGHLPAVLARCGGAHRVVGYTAPPLGTHAVRGLEQSIVQLAAGDLLVLYTDGLVERRGEDIDRGIERLVRTAPLVSGLSDPALALVDDLAPDAADDVCVVTLRVC